MRSIPERLCIDIGCGEWKEKGYLGLDAFRGPEVDFVLDLERDNLPFANDTVDHAVSFHCLEHLRDLKHIMHEIWRVLKPNAQFFVAVPYFNSFCHFANIFHVQNFNEHSFRFFSSEQECRAIPERLWKYHFTPTWGLKGSANEVIETEFRTCKIELDPFPEYRGTSEADLEKLRLQRPNVVHQICYYLQAIKPTMRAVSLSDSDLIIPQRRQWQIERNW
jgi:SAM-dependent methyltransferase